MELDEVVQLRRAMEPDAVRASLADHAYELATAAQPHGEHTEAVRTAEYRGHAIEVRTRYEITVDGRPFDVHVTVDNGGRVHYHGLPTRDFASVVHLVMKAIDEFPDDFGGRAPGDLGGQTGSSGPGSDTHAGPGHDGHHHPAAQHPADGPEV